MLDKMCNGTGKGVVAKPRVANFDILSLLLKGAGRGLKRIGIG